MLKTISEVVKYRGLIHYLVVTDLRVRYRGSLLGFLWTLLNPLMLTLVLWLVFSKFGQVDEKNYALFLLSGLMVWIFFSQSVTAALTSIIKQRGLIQKIYVPKIVFPLSVVLSNLTNFIFFLIAYGMIALLTPIGLSPINLMVVPVIGMVFLLSVGGALIMATLNVFFRDFSHLTEVILRLMFYLTPILYRPELFGAKAQFFFKLNPAYYPIVTARSVLYDQVMPPPEFWLIGYGVAILSCVLGLYIFVKSQDKFVYYA
jgi:ABC-type polysaccharide/polyol phosphate export permease